MLVHSSSGCAVCPQIERMIQDILKEDARFERDLRSVHRERLVCPVEIKLDGLAEKLSAFSRNISSKGVSLVTDFAIEERANATLEIHRLNEKGGNKIVAECRWCKPFGDKYWISGWQFKHVPRR